MGKCFFHIQRLCDYKQIPMHRYGRRWRALRCNQWKYFTYVLHTSSIIIRAHIVRSQFFVAGCCCCCSSRIYLMPLSGHCCCCRWLAGERAGGRWCYSLIFLLSFFCLFRPRFGEIQLNWHPCASFAFVLFCLLLSWSSCCSYVRRTSGTQRIFDSIFFSFIAFHDEWTQRTKQKQQQQQNCELNFTYFRGPVSCVSLSPLEINQFRSKCFQNWNGNKSLSLSFYCLVIDAILRYVVKPTKK